MTEHQLVITIQLSTDQVKRVAQSIQVVMKDLVKATVRAELKRRPPGRPPTFK